MKQQTLVEYFAALERLKKGRPTLVPKGTKITNDAVALEAGRGKGTIKKSRSVFADLIRCIDEAAEELSKPKNMLKQRQNKDKSKYDHCRLMLEAALGREVSLVYQVYNLKKKLAHLTGEKVLPIRGKSQLVRERLEQFDEYHGHGSNGQDQVHALGLIEKDTVQ